MKYLSFFFGLLFTAPLYAYAADPSVASFVAGSYSLNSGQSASFAWNVADSGGYSFIIPCTLGIKFKKTNGSVFPCDIPVASVATAIDGIDLSVWNLSGTTKSFTARIIPKDAMGADFFNGHKDIQVSVAPVTEPIESISGTAIITPSGTPYTLSWSGSLIDGVNLSISCAPAVRTTSTSYTVGEIPCNTPIFTNGLPASGSITLSFNNSAPLAQNITLTITPMMAPGIYNGMQTKSISVSIESNIVPDPVVITFNTSTTTDRILDGIPISLSWTTEKSNGANLLISCNENISVVFTVGSVSSTPKCGAPAFNPRISMSGTGMVTFTNKNIASETIKITLVPERKTGGFDATRGKDLTFSIIPKSITANTIAPVPARTVVSQTAPAPTTAPATTPTQTQSSVQSTPATGSISSSQASSEQAAKKVFTKSLVRGSAGTEVRALQEFLKKDKALYPEGIVNGTFGPATERAVKRFQQKYNIANTGTPGYGGVGPRTRELLNSLVSK